MPPRGSDCCHQATSCKDHPSHPPAPQDCRQQLTASADVHRLTVDAPALTQSSPVAVDVQWTLPTQARAHVTPFDDTAPPRDFPSLFSNFRI